MSGACCETSGAVTLEQVRPPDALASDRLQVALAGQPNVGKSTVFNSLTGLNQHVGNWPGKTVEQKIGVHKHGNVKLELVDLPGTYSLTANSPEELIAREYLLKQRPDAIVAIVDASILERSLYLVAELVQLGLPLVVGLNMIDVASRQGTRVDVPALSHALGVPVVALVAARNVGLDSLVEAAIEAARSATVPLHLPTLQLKLNGALAAVEHFVAPVLPEAYPLHWAAVKLLEGDSALLAQLRAAMGPTDWAALDRLLQQHADAALSIASARYDWIAQAIRVAVAQPAPGSGTLTARLDRLATHPIFGLGVLAAILAGLFVVTYSIGTPLQEWLEANVIGGLSSWLNALLINAPHWVRGLIVDGAVGGAGTVLTFVPILLIFFAGMALLEDVGYMARAAYLMDGFMRLMGLHGKSFLPLFLGFGCNVPAVVGTRVIESERARLLSIVLAPLVPCTARMAVVAFMAPAFFGSGATLAAFGLVMINLLALAVAGAFLGRTVLKSGRAAFIMELPSYHIPKLRSIGLIVWKRTVGFVRQAGTAILIMSLLVWALAHIPTGDVATSWLGEIGRFLSPLGGLMGMSWQLLVALLASFVAKENSIAILGVLFGAADNHTQLATVLAKTITPTSALSFLVVSMLFIPCASTVAAIKQETRSTRWTLLSIGLLAVISFGVGIVVYQVASRLV